MAEHVWGDFAGDACQVFVFVDQEADGLVGEWAFVAVEEECVLEGQMLGIAIAISYQGRQCVGAAYGYCSFPFSFSNHLDHFIC